MPAQALSACAAWLVPGRPAGGTRAAQGLLQPLPLAPAAAAAAPAIAFGRPHRSAARHSSFLLGFLFGQGPDTGPGSAGMLVPAYNGDPYNQPPGTAEVEEMRAEAVERARAAAVEIGCEALPEGWFPAPQGRTAPHCFWGSAALTPGDFPGAPRPPQGTARPVGLPAGPPAGAPRGYNLPSGPVSVWWELGGDMPGKVH
mmetsp:Transcript_43779/g.121657  ORF Transcript_43779/g.121657 Transcript_43779/m.121657 type:complete len:200 (-) Transcript_43779:162-761(-)